MALRNIIEIDENKCNGCGLCIPNCPEGALQIIDDKARLISDLFCDGLGACIGECPQGAIRVIQREAEPYDERKVMENIVKQGENTIAAHLKHLKDHNEAELLDEAIKFLKDKNIKNPLESEKFEKGSGSEITGQDRLPCGCPGTMVMDLREEKLRKSPEDAMGLSKEVNKNSGMERVEEIPRKITNRESKLRQWPIQIALVPPNAPYLKDADLLVAADCAPFSYAGFHEDILDGKVLLIGCPKLDDSEFYLKKITEIIRQNDLNSITVAHMEVPCCFGLLNLVKQALKDSGKNIPIGEINIGIKGKIIVSL